MVPEDTFLWLVVYTTNNRYYPQCNNALEGQCNVSDVNNQWGVTAYLGRANCKEPFELVLIAVDEVGNDFLTNTMISWAAAGDFPGLVMSELPDETTELDSIAVETEGDTCP